MAGGLLRNGNARAAVRRAGSAPLHSIHSMRQAGSEARSACRERGAGEEMRCADWRGYIFLTAFAPFNVTQMLAPSKATPHGRVPAA